MGFLVELIRTAFTVYKLMIGLRLILSFFPVDPRAPWMQFLYQATEPVLAPFRRVLPPVGGLDFSPILVFFVLQFAEGLVIDVLWQLSRLV